MLPTLNLKNQFGEPINAFVVGGSSKISCQFTVNAADAGGFGLTGLTKTFGISNVFMHTSQTAGSGNPNPAAGYIAVEFSEAFADLQGLTYKISPPLSGTNVNVTTGLSQFGAYVITGLGTTPASGWHTLGVPTGITPAVGVAFIAATASVGSGTGTVQIMKAAGPAIFLVGVLGTPSVNLAPAAGGQLLFVCLGPTSVSNPTLIPVNPADGTVMSLAFNLVATAAPSI